MIQTLKGLTVIQTIRKIFFEKASAMPAIYGWPTKDHEVLDKFDDILAFEDYHVRVTVEAVLLPPHYTLSEDGGNVFHNASVRFQKLVVYKTDLIHWIKIGVANRHKSYDKEVAAHVVWAVYNKDGVIADCRGIPFWIERDGQLLCLHEIIKIIPENRIYPNWEYGFWDDTAVVEKYGPNAVDIMSDQAFNKVFNYVKSKYGYWAPPWGYDGIVIVE